MQAASPALSESSLGITDIPQTVWVPILSVYMPVTLLKILLFTELYTNQSFELFKTSAESYGSSSCSVGSFSRLGILWVAILGANVYAWSIATGLKWRIDASSHPVHSSLGSVADRICSDCKHVSVPSGDRASPELTDNSVSLCLQLEVHSSGPQPCA